MDKRYLLIIIIICICCVNLYIISNNSDIIGSASADIKNYTFTLPEGFSLYEDNGNQILISNPTTQMNVSIYTSLSKNDTFSNKYNEINSSDKYNILSNGSIDHEGIHMDSVFYQRVKDSSNRSTFYFTKDNAEFRILIVGFNYDLDKNKIITLVSDIVDSIRANYKI